MSDNSRRQFLINTSLAGLASGLMTDKLLGTKNEKPQQTTCDPTTLDYYGEGPFYTDNPPFLGNNKLAADSEKGTRMIISGRVLNLDCNEYLGDTIIDVWHADDTGAYDNQGFKLRGYVKSNSEGFYLFETIYPGKYLNGSSFRPSHIHFKITPPNFPTITTQLYFDGDPDLANDAAAKITEGQYDARKRIISLNENNGVLEGTWDIIVDGEGISGTNDLHLSKGMIYAASPNPFTDTLNINYGVFRSSNVSLSVLNLNGIQVAELEGRKLNAEKYNASWIPSADLPSGHYFVILKINDLQVHYVKVFYQK